MIEPTIKRAVAFVDGQNLFHGAREAFGYRVANFDPVALTRSVCATRAWVPSETRFYTGIPDAGVNPRLHAFWQRKLAVLGTRNAVVFSRPLRYQNKMVPLPGGGTTTVLVGQEKGVDVRIALDIVRLARERRFDVALVFSQDQDLSEVAMEIRDIAHAQDRWIKMASAYPVSPTSRNRRGINGTDWISLDRMLYDSCLDPTDYFAALGP